MQTPVSSKLHQQAAPASCTSKLHQQAAPASCTSKLHQQANFVQKYCGCPSTLGKFPEVAQAPRGPRVAPPAIALL